MGDLALTTYIHLREVLWFVKSNRSVFVGDDSTVGRFSVAPVSDGTTTVAAVPHLPMLAAMAPQYLPPGYHQQHHVPIQPLEVSVCLFLKYIFSYANWFLGKFPENSI